MMDLAWLLRDTRYCLVVIFSDLITSIAAISGVFLLALRFEDFSGISSSEVLFMLAFLMLTKGIREMFIASANVSNFSRRIGRGQLEHMFIQPLPFSLQLLTEGFIPFSGNSNLICGFLLMHYAIRRMELVPTGWFWMQMVIYLITSVATITGVSYFFSAAAFYAPVACEEISMSVFDISESLMHFPLSGMPQMMQMMLLTVLPTGILGWFPCLALLGRPPLHFPSWYPLSFCALVWSLALFAIRKGMRYYVRVGINRYSAAGHRS